DKEFIHAEIGECLEKLYEPNADEIAAQLAIHFYRGHILDKVVSYCLKAAQDANARYGAAEALHFVKMGLQALESRIKVLPQQEYAETKVQLLLELARSEKNGGDPQEKKDHIQEGINYLESSLSLLYNLSDKFYAEIYSELGKLYDRKGLKYSKKVKEYLEKALYVYEKQNNKRNVAEILYHLAGADVYPNILSAPGEKNPEEKCIDVLRKAILIAEQMQDIDLQIKCTIRLSAHMKRKDFRYAEKGVLRALELWENFGKSDKSFEVLIEMAYICRQGYARHKTGIKYLNQALEFAKRTGDVGLESWILYVVGASFGFYTTLQRKAQITMEEALLIREKTGIRKYLMLSRIGNIFLRQGQWKNAEEYIQKAINESRWERYNLWQLYLFQENYPQAEKELLHKLEQREKYKRFPNILIYTGLALNYALLGKEEQSQKYLEHAYSLLEQKTIPIEKSEALYIIAETQRLLENFESSKIACQQALSWFLTNAEDPEELISVAEVRLTMGKILVDMADYQEAITYLDKAKAAFEICGHYALGETLLYLGKAHLGLGGVIFQRQAQEYLNQALAEFQRLELRHKEQEAKEVLKAL
ncbi:MAG: hypothetical protein JW725_05620, partial [Candidatus Babeliaceae bacterium]|nr:hypothetical protein [Candidatus Babeliaceae bacterium]